MASPKVRERLSQIADQRTRLLSELDSIELGLAVGAELIEEGLALLENAEELYSRADDAQRQLLNRALFQKLYVRDGDIVSAIFNEPFDEFLSARESPLIVQIVPNWGTFTPGICTNTTGRLETALFFWAGVLVTPSWWR